MSEEIDRGLAGIIDYWQRRARQAEAAAAALRRALDTIDRCPVGACESPTGDIEPCDVCGEMRTIAEQALRATDAGATLLAELDAARAVVAAAQSYLRYDRASTDRIRLADALRAYDQARRR